MYHRVIITSKWNLCYSRLIPLSEQKELSDLIKSLETFEDQSEDKKSIKESGVATGNLIDIPEVSLCHSLTDAISAASAVLSNASLALADKFQTFQEASCPSNFAPIDFASIAPISRISEVFLSDDEENLQSQVSITQQH